MIGRFNNLTEHLDKLKGIALRLSMKLPPNSHRAIAKSLGFDHERYPALDPHIQVLLSVRKYMTAANEGPKPHPEVSRQSFRRDMAAIANPMPVASVKDFEIPSRAGKLTVRHYTPILHEGASKTSKPLPLLLFFHGGSFIVGDVDTHDDPCRLFCQHGQMQVLSVSYRLLPEHPSPAAVEDCLDTLKWAYEHAAELGAEPTKIAVGGDSAGGNLAAVISQLAVGTDYAPAAQLLMYPSLDLVSDYPSHHDFGQGLFLSRVDVEYCKELHVSRSLLPFSDPRVSPMFGHLTGLPPALIVTAAFDSLRDEGETYALKMREAGSHCIAYRVEGQGHGFVSMATVNHAAFKATRRIAKDFRMLLDGLN